MAKEYNLIIKQKGFNPAPISGNIPKFADSRNYPKVRGTANYIEWWNEQYDRCINGFHTGGMFIPPKLYHFLNFTIIDGVGAGAIYPYFIDLQYELYRLEHEIRNDRTVAGAVIPKARRKGLSFFGVEQVNWGCRFIDSYRAGVAGGLEVYVDGFRNKLYRLYNNTVDEFGLNHLKRNDKELKLGFEYDNNGRTDEFLIAHILFQTMKDQASKMEGEYFHDYISEETGEFKEAKEALLSISPATKDGDEYVGKSWIYGTGGKMAKGGKTFQIIYQDADGLDLIKDFIPGYRYYPPYVRVGNNKHKTPNLDALQKELKLSSEQLLGCEDIACAKESLALTKAKLSKLPNKKDLIQHMQNYPDTVEDVFTSSGTNHFNTELLYSQLFQTGEYEPKYNEYVLEFSKDKNGNFIVPLKVYARPATTKDKPYEIVKILKGGLPDDNFKNLDIVGIDGYNEDITTSNNSLGGICVLRRADKIISNDYHLGAGIIPVCVYYERPPRKEKFFEIGLKVALFYKSFRNTMISAESDLVIDYFVKNGGKHLLAKRPRTFDAPNSELKHEFGVKMTSYSKPRMISVMQTVVEDNTLYNWFPELLKDLIAYDEENIGTDWDLADAYGIALTRIWDMRVIPEEKNAKNNEDDSMDIIQWKTINGVKTPVKEERHTKKDLEKQPWLAYPSAFDSAK